MKEYKSNEELIKYLISKNVLVNNERDAINKIEKYTYYSVINSYKNNFKDSNNNYLPNVTFDEIFALYEFDKNLKYIILKYALEIETVIKSLMANQISKVYGLKDYLNINNLDDRAPLQIKENIVNRINDEIDHNYNVHSAVTHYKDTYGYIPFYVLSKCLTFGTIKKLFNVMKQVDQDDVCNLVLFREIPKKKISRTKQMIALIADVRNMCAHDEIVFSFVHGSIDIGLLPEHGEFKLKTTKNGDLIQGRKDLFALLLSMKYFMNRTDYNKMIQRIDALITKTASKSTVYSKEDLLDTMNLPLDFVKIRQI